MSASDPPTPIPRPKVLIVASGGGHWVQMRRLWGAFDGMDVAFATTQPDYAPQVGGRRFYVVLNFTRRNPGQMLAFAPKFVRILLIERPDMVITTGAAPGLVALALAKVFTRAKTVWIDSIANVDEMSTSGSWARFVADAWLTQWPQLSRAKGPHYWGAVL